MIEINRQEADLLDSKLRKYIESSRLEKLEISLLMVDKFFYLKILNLSTHLNIRPKLAQKHRVHELFS